MVRVRFAPSPTGLLHIGNARTALFNWLYAKRYKGSFILRVEDTDVARSEKRYTEQIIEDLRWLGLDWQEGPGVGGDYGPYIQSERLHLYREFSHKLLNDAKAYHCYCTPQELEERRQTARSAGKPPRYDNRCRNLSDEQRNAFEGAGRPSSIRFVVSEEVVAFEDLVRGRCAFDMGLVGDFVIMKSDDTPSFHFAVAVDDALMKITHVIRGEDHLSNTPCHILLFRALGYDPPLFAHISLTMGPDRTLLSKRHGAASVSEYRRLGYLPEALVNYMALLGWCPGDKREKFNIEDAVKKFDVKDISKSASIFDQQKLDWLGSQYLREANLDRLTDLSIPHFKQSGLIQDGFDRAKIKSIVEAVRPGLSRLLQIPDEARFFFEEPTLDKKVTELLSSNTAERILTAMLKKLQQISGLDKSSPYGDKFREIVKDIGVETSLKGKALLMPIRLALTGKERGPELFAIAPILGLEECKKRIENALLILTKK
ncbi:MAG TPA: glutamate--tRNA ligase [Candidatus Brocadiia bacterium]|nr:glutamate--tRNA ligase [Planctomycetota bacterium]MDO8093133.1 glutamate--tRNA ligase [Candidatus Brocadiales bacterium]